MGNGSYQMLIVCLLIALCPHMGEGCNNQGKKAKPKIWCSICSENDRNHAGREQDTPNCKGKTDYGYWKECREGQTYCVARLGPKPGNEWQRHCADKGFVEGLIAKHKENGTTRISGLRGRECADEEAIIAKRDEEFKKEMEDQAGGPHGPCTRLLTIASVNSMAAIRMIHTVLSNETTKSMMKKARGFTWFPVLAPPFLL